MKKLDWVLNWGKEEEAYTPFGYYKILHCEEEVYLYFEFQEYVSKQFDTPALAKAYAEQDWEERLKQCL